MFKLQVHHNNIILKDVYYINAYKTLLVLKLFNNEGVNYSIYIYIYIINNNIHFIIKTNRIEISSYNICLKINYRICNSSMNNAH